MLLILSRGEAVLKVLVLLLVKQSFNKRFVRFVLMGGSGLIRILRTGCLAGALLSAGLGLKEMYRAAQSNIKGNGIERVLERGSENMDLSYEIGLYHLTNSALYLGSGTVLLFFGLLLPRYDRK